MAQTKRKAGVPVSTRALIQRINRKLAERDQVLRTARGERARTELGDYFVIDVHRNVLTLYRVNLEVLGRELGALQPWEAYR